MGMILKQLTYSLILHLLKNPARFIIINLRLSGSRVSHLGS